MKVKSILLGSLLAVGSVFAGEVNEDLAARYQHYFSKENSILERMQETDKAAVLAAEAETVRATPDFPVYLEDYLGDMLNEYDVGRTGLDGWYEPYMDSRFKNCVIWAGNVGQLMINCDDLLIGQQVAYVLYRPASQPLDNEVLEATISELDKIDQMFAKAKKTWDEHLAPAQDDAGCKVEEVSESTGIKLLNCKGEYKIGLPVFQEPVY